ncbi:hypothetical protein PXJ20_31755 [Paraburkholderia sp. A1RI_3L]|uniref:hypothetical protein n=1 Tax=Paraburkholderia TaxID=1822464 RepID=UPI003B829AFE
MKIHCISCGHQLDLDDQTYEHYDGLVRCWVCKSMMKVHIVDSSVESLTFPDTATSSREAKSIPPSSPPVLHRHEVAKPQPIPQSQGVAS